MGKTYIAKTSSGDFKITTHENLLLSQQAVISKGISVPYTNLQLNLTLIPNWTCSIVTISPFKCKAPSTWLINLMHRSQCVAYSPTWKKCWLQSSSVHQHNEDNEIPWLQNPKCTNTVASWRKRWTMAYIFSSQYACEKLLHWVVSVVMALKTILIYV